MNKSPSFFSLLSPFEDFCRKVFDTIRPSQVEHREGAILWEAMNYAFFSGGKRFRPLLGLTLAHDLLGSEEQRESLYPWLMAVEMIHTYSLIHDDLPALDNDDYRRGRPTCHKKFGEDMAILAGDALSSEAFRQILIGYRSDPELGVKLSLILSEKMGPQGMVLGQVIDLRSKREEMTKDHILEMHRLKTGGLIEATLLGCGHILGLKPEAFSTLALLGRVIGIAFQVKDDLLDSKEHIELGSLPAIIGIDKAKKYLEELDQETKRLLIQLGLNNDSLFVTLTEFNVQRQH